jgi:hypothetical protein
VLTHNEIGKELAVCMSCDPFDRFLSNRGRRRRHSAYLDRCGLQQCQNFSGALGIHEKGRLARGGERFFMSRYSLILKIKYISIIGECVAVLET